MGYKIMVQGNVGGRPPKVLTNDEKVQVEALAAYLSQDQIADYLGISRPTFSAIMDRDDEVCLRYKKGKAKAIETIAKSLIQQGIEGNTTAQIFYLKTQAGWKETQVQEHTITTQNAEFTKEELIAECEKRGLPTSIFK